MKQFLKYVLATVVGIGLWTLILGIICMISLVGMSLSETPTTPVKKGSVLRIRLNGTLGERGGEDNPFIMIFQGDMEALGLDEVKKAIREAATNDKVVGIYLEAGTTFAGAEPALLQELRQSLVEFRESGKWILAYGEIFTTGTYYLASVADKVVMHTEGMLDWHGMASQIMFYTDLMKKVGVEMQVFKVGTYKSAVEPYINTAMSEANREQVTSYLSSIWGQYLQEVGESRGLTTDVLNRAADTLLAMQPACTAVEMGLVDTLAYIDGVKTMLRQQAEVDEDDDLHFVGVKDLLAVVEEDDEDDLIAVYYADGEIVDVEAQALAQDASIVGNTMVEDLKNLREDDDVKAVVIRVNSPGGSAFASEKIWREVELLKAEKPVVVSMAGLAASGGYYISCGADKIIAEPTTLTGSIGIFGMVPDPSTLLNDKLGLHFDVVKTNKMSDFGTLGRPMNADEKSLMQAYVERGYDLFTRRVAEGRGLSQDSVDAIGQGRVWTGEQALELGLVDGLGNLETAVREAAALAELDKYACETYPAASDWLEMFMEQEKEDYLTSHMKATLGEWYPALAAMKAMTNTRTLQQAVYARVPYEIVIR